MGNEAVHARHHDDEQHCKEVDHISHDCFQHADQERREIQATQEREQLDPAKQTSRGLEAP
jgi:hypothetical protein